jgi:hypothetical protein
MHHANLSGLIDPRLSNRHSSLVKSLFKGRSISIQSISDTRADQIGNYRLLQNSSLSEAMLISEIVSRCSKAVKGHTVLCIHDSSEANFFNHSNRLKKNTGLGPIDASGKKGIGFKIHNSIVLDAKSLYPYGISNIKIWERDKKQAGAKWANRKLSSKHKESCKWQDGCKASEEVLEDAKKIIHIQDREGDMYDQIVDFKNDNRVFHIIRLRFNRITEDGTKINERIDNTEVLGQYKLAISADSHGKRNKRIATMSVKIISLKIQRPKRDREDLAPQSELVTIIETKEMDAPNGTEPLHWMLITNCKVATLEDAMQVITWYESRWAIEEFYRILKKENFDIEKSELETGWALRKLSIITMDTSLKIFQIMYCRELIPENETLESISSFSEDELECLKQLNKKYNGVTQKLQNPYKEKTIQWVVWILSRMGGWKGYGSQRKPGATTILNGLQKFYEVYSGWSIAIDVCTR